MVISVARQMRFLLKEQHDQGGLTLCWAMIGKLDLAPPLLNKVENNMSL